MNPTPSPRALPVSLHVLALVLGVLTADAARAADGLPPRSTWVASSSASTTVEMAPAKAIDGDPATKWGGAFSQGHWYQVDLGKRTAVGALELHWEWGGARTYTIEASDDGEHWRTAFRTRDGVGGISYDVFPSVQARYLRLAAPDRTADWGVSVFEFQPYAAGDAPRIRGAGSKAATLWTGDGVQAMQGAPAKDGTRQVEIDLPRPLSLAGLEVFWKDTPGSARLEGREAGSDHWITLAEDPRAYGDSAFLADTQARTLSALRLSVQATDARAPTLQRLRLIGPKRVMTAMKRYELAASREYADLFPSSLHQQQVYWTAIGIPAGRQKSVLDEFGHVEAFKGAPLVQPIWRDASGRASAANTQTAITHTLRDGWMPMPSVQWSPQPGLELTTSAIAIEQRGAPVTLVRYRLHNTGSTPVAGTLNLLTRPMQVSPPWQNGGPSPIRDIAIDTAAGNTAVKVNGRTLFQSLVPVQHVSASAFGAHGEGEITRLLVAGTLPDSRQAHEDSGLAAGQVGYDVALAAGATQDIVIAFALGDARLDPAKPLPAAPAIDLAPLIGDDAFDRLGDQVAKQWQARLGRIGLSLPDASLVDMLRAQAAYMLINQSGHAMQPGPRNYNRSFIRDGAATAATLVRMGMPKTARDYLQWYAGHAVHENGLVSPILNDDGSVNTGFGSDIEYDSQGQLIWLVAEIARLDGGAASVRAYQDKVTRAMKFMQELRERTMVPGYLADQPSPERFHGILAPSISHEGYPVPTHSYWDDYWALKGWHDGAWLAEQWGDAKTAAWARQQYAALRASLSASISATMTWKGIDTIPADADMGGSDPTSLSIGLDPAGQQDVMPADALKTTFDRYLDEVRKRDAPDALYAYTPYEIRNVLTYVHLNRPQEAHELLMRFLGDRRPAPWQVLAEVVYSDPRHAIYLGDMPHTWIGSEYARAIFGMLMHEGDDALSLLPGTPPAWVAGDGLHVDGLPTAYGTLAMAAKQEGQTLRITLGAGLRKDTALKVSWPNRTKPSRVTVDGKAVTDFDDQGLRTTRPFKDLIATW
ncbi:discoidin domain-containing protein [Pseudoxanthomonas sp.]|uniref:discoidin domain-containing protein n=1 Tax=Pseudoxanthomonas sp. TaxID=1871049 RepID=UPI002FE2CA95